MYLLDTNICIYLMKNSFPSMTERVFSHSPSEFYISSITVFELEYGAAKSKWDERTRQNLHLFLAPFNILEFDSSDTVSAGMVRAHLEENGTPIGAYDVQLAGQALSKSLIFITHNVEEFGRVPGLAIADWVKEG